MSSRDTYFVATTTVTSVPDLLPEAAVALGDLGRRRDGHESLARRDELARGLELGLAPVELAVQLPAAELGEDLADARRLLEAERREVGAADLEPHVAQAREVLAQLRTLLAREREQRRVGRERIRERGDLGRSELRGLQALDDPGRDGDRSRDPVRRRGAAPSAARASRRPPPE